MPTVPLVGLGRVKIFEEACGGYYDGYRMRVRTFMMELDGWINFLGDI